MHSFHRAIGGHVVYDTSISLSVLAYCLLVRAQAFGATSAVTSDYSKMA